MNSWNTVASDDSISAVVDALSNNGIKAVVVTTKEEALALLKNTIPQGAQVMTNTSASLDTIGATPGINESGEYDSVRVRMNALDPEKDALLRQQLGAAPDWAVGSVHAVTENGEVFIASSTGSQLASYVYGALNVLWVVGAQKIVKNADDAIARIYEYTLPLENERALKAYGVGSKVRKLLRINEEVRPGRITMIIVKEAIGF